jgi:translation initiation factor IF-3
VETSDRRPRPVRRAAFPLHPPAEEPAISKPPPRQQPRRDLGPRVNERIRAPKIRVVDGATSALVGIMSPQEAISIARSRGLDLVEISPMAQPPVCKIIDFGKWKYEQAKNAKDKHKHRQGKVKEVKFRASIDPHDYQIKLTRAEDFLHHGDKLRFVCKLVGRQMAHPEIAIRLMEKVIQDLKTMGHPDMPPKLSGKAVGMSMSPLPENQRVRKFRLHDEKYELGEDDSHEADEDDEEHEE